MIENKDLVAVDAVWSEPVSPANSLITRDLQGNFARKQIKLL